MALPRDDADAEPAPSSLEDAVVLRAAAGDARAFHRLYERHAPRVHRFVRDLLRDDSAADEATQETFVRAHARLGSLREAGKVRAWLLGIARLVVMEMWRARGGQTSLDDAGEDAEPVALATQTPEQLLIGHQAQAALVDALADLRPDRRAALLLATDHELPYDEIATIMGWSVAKVKVEIHRTRRELRLKLAVHLGGRS